MKQLAKLQLLALMLFTALTIMAQPPPDGDVETGGGGRGYAGIDSLAQFLPKEVSFYSNAKNIFIDLNGYCLAGAELTIMNVQGQIVNKQKIASNYKSIINSNLIDGLYIVSIFANNKYLIKKVFIDN